MDIVKIDNLSSRQHQEMAVIAQNFHLPTTNVIQMIVQQCNTLSSPEALYFYTSAIEKFMHQLSEQSSGSLMSHVHQCGGKDADVLMTFTNIEKLVHDYLIKFKTDTKGDET